MAKSEYLAHEIEVFSCSRSHALEQFDKSLRVESKNRIPFRCPPSPLFFIYSSIYLSIMNQTKTNVEETLRKMKEDREADRAFSKRLVADLLQRTIEETNEVIRKLKYEKLGDYDSNYYQLIGRMKSMEDIMKKYGETIFQ